MMRLTKGWQVALAGSGINFLMSFPAYAWSIIASRMILQLGWSPVQAALPYTVFLISYSLFMVPTGRWQDRVGPRAVITTGGIILGGASLLSAFLLTPLVTILLWGAVYGFGAACVYSSTTPAAMKWFPLEKKSLVAGVVVTGSGISAFVMAPLVFHLVSIGIRPAFIFLGLILLGGILLLSQLVSTPPGYNSQKHKSPVSGGLGEILKNPQFIMLWFMFWVTTGTGVTFVTHLDTMTLVHAAYNRGYILVALFAFFNAVGRITAGLIADRIGTRKTMIFDFSITLLVLVLLLRAASPLEMGLLVSVLGITYGGLYTLFPATVAANFGEQNFGLVFGLVFTGLGAGGIFPLLSGYLFARQGHFFGAFMILIAACSLVLLVSFFLKKPDKMKPA